MKVTELNLNNACFTLIGVSYVDLRSFVFNNPCNLCIWRPYRLCSVFSHATVHSKQFFCDSISIKNRLRLWIDAWILLWTFQWKNKTISRIELKSHYTFEYSILFNKLFFFCFQKVLTTTAGYLLILIQFQLAKSKSTYRDSNSILKSV